MGRSESEILERLKGIEAEGGFLNFAPEVLREALGFEWCKAHGGTKEDAEPWESWDGKTLEEAARSYLEFAYDKATDHRGISANRSVDKMREFAWLLGRDDVVEAMDAAEYVQYGAPKLKACADGLGWDFPDDNDNETLARMARGESCEEMCEEGCGVCSHLH